MATHQQAEHSKATRNWHAVSSANSAERWLFAVLANQVFANTQFISSATNTSNAALIALKGSGAYDANATARGKEMRARPRFVPVVLLIVSTTRLTNGGVLSSIVSGFVANFRLLC